MTAEGLPLRWAEKRDQHGVVVAHPYRIIYGPAGGAVTYRVYHAGRWLGTVVTMDLAKGLAEAHRGHEKN